jgi:hypothetical protein
VNLFDPPIVDFFFNVNLLLETSKSKSTIWMHDTQQY